MAFIRYKQRGNKYYVYEVSNIWNKEQKKYHQHTKYLGVATEKGGPYIEVQRRSIKIEEKSIVDFGDGFMVHQMLSATGLASVISDVTNNSDTILALIAYQLAAGKAMYNCAEWAEGNVISHLLPKARLDSQHISKIINQMGSGNFQQKFFQFYISKFFQDTHGVLIDSTAMPSSINSSINAWGHSAEGIREKINCLLLVDKHTKLPIYFRVIAGDIADVSTLAFTIDEISRLGLQMEQAIFDAGYFSEANVKYLCSLGVNFISRLPKSRQIFKELVSEAKQIENLSNIVIYGERVLFIESKKIDLYGYQAYAHIIFDPSKKARDINKLMLHRAANPSEIKDYETAMQNCGFFILLSSEAIANTEIMPSYYTRQGIEQIFDLAKNDASLLPLRVHSEQAINGYLLLVFLSVTLAVMIKNKLGSKWTLEQALAILRCHKAKIYPTEIIPLEPRKKDKDIYSTLHITVPTKCGI